MDSLPGFWMRRLYKLHRSAEEFVEAVLCDAVKYDPMTHNPDGSTTLHWKVRWWNPAAWIAYSRTVIFRDKYGCAYYRRVTDGEI